MPLSSSINTRLEYQYKTIFELFEGLSDASIRLRVWPDKWSAFENVVHLVTYQHVFLARMEKILNSDTPFFERYFPDTDPLFVENCEKTSHDIIKDLLQTRKKIGARLHDLSDDQLRRIGVHPLFGQLTVLQWTEFFLLHEAHHLYTLFKLTCELRKQGHA